MARVERAGRDPAGRIREAGRPLARAVRALPRMLLGWPGVDASVLAYAVAAAALYRHPDVQLLGVLAALAVGVAWYASPARAWEAGRRRRQAGRSQ